METQQIFLRDLKPGDVWFICDPARIAQVIGPEEVVYSSRGAEVRQPGVRVRVTVPPFVVPGLVSDRAVHANQEILAGIRQECRARDGDDTEWIEIWSERMVRQITRSAEGGYYMPDEKKPRIAQCYHHGSENRISPRDRHTGATRGQLFGVKVDNAPERFFPHDEAAPTILRPDPEGVLAQGKPGPVPLPRQIGKLRQMAKLMGVDVSDIDGKGSVGKIVERLTNAPHTPRQTPDPQRA